MAKKFYGQDKDKKTQKSARKELVSFLSDKGVSYDPEKLGKYVRAITYGGYSQKDVLRDIRAESQGKATAIKVGVDKATRKQRHPELFGPVKNRTGQATQTTASATEDTGPTKSAYAGTGQYGELPKRDAQGHYSWIMPNGERYEQPGFQLSGDESGWEYLGDHTPTEWTSAEALYKTQPPPLPASQMPEWQKQEFIDQAHKEISQQFTKAVAEGQNDLVYKLGSTLQEYANQMKAEDRQMDDDIQATVDALENTGMSFSGKGREQLGDFFSAAGVLSAQDRAQILQNIEQINSIRQGAVTQGQSVNAVQMPRPDGIDNPVLTDAQKEQMWRDFFNTDSWKSYTTQLNTSAGNNPNQTGLVGSGQYGVGDQMSRFANTRALEGSVLQRNRLMQESSRSTFNANVRNLGTAAEQQLGSANLGNLVYPTIGGQQIFKPGQNILGTEQQTYLGGGGNYGAGIYGRANTLAGNLANQYSYTLPI